MTDARQRGLWHRTWLTAGAGAMLLVAAAATTEGCSDDTESTTTTAPTTSSSATSSASGTGGGGGSGGSGGEGGGSAVFEVKAACNEDTFNTPFDATPDPEGVNVYFTALDSMGQAAVFKGPAAGGGPCAPVHAGDPLVAPFSLTVSSDSKTIYVGDLGSDDGAGADAGHIFTLPAGGGMPTALMGTEGMRPRGLDTLKDQNGDILYFTGTDKTTGEHGVFRLAGGNVAAVAKGAPFVDPSGIAVATNGTAYVCDTTGTPSRTANILLVEAGGTVSSYVSDLRASYPCGVAMTTNQQALLVSALDPLTETDVIVRISLETKEVQYLSKDISGFTEAAGMHRAKNADSFAWADSKANKTGTVFTITAK